MIFQTIKDETALSGQRIVTSLQARKIAQQQATAQLLIDVDCLNRYKIECDRGTVTTNKFNKIMQNASASAVRYSAEIKAKTGTVRAYANAQRATNVALQEVSLGATIAKKAVDLLSVALNMFAFTAIVSGFQMIIKAIDDYIHREERAEEKLSSSVNVYETAKKELEAINSELEEQSKRIDELLSKDSLTYTEQDELEKLQKITKELELQKALKEEEVKRNAREVKNNAVESFKTKYNINAPQEDYLIDANYNSLKANGVNTSALINKNNLNEQIAAYRILQEEQQKALDRQDENYQEFADRTQIVRDNLYENLDTLTNLKKQIDEVPFEELSKEEQEIFQYLEKSIDYIWNEVDPISLSNIFDRKDIELTKEEFIELRKAGELDEKTLRSYPKLTKALSELNLCIEEGTTNSQVFLQYIDELSKKDIPDMAIEEPPSFNPSSVVETVNLLEEMSDKWKSVDELYAEFLEKGTGQFNNENMANLVKSFEEISGVDIDGFLAVLSDSSSTAENVQEAFDRLATQYIYTSGCLKGLTDATAEQVIKELEAQGVANASEVIYNYLAAAKEYAAITGRDLAEATVDEIVAFINETNASLEAKGAIAGYALQKELANGATLDTSGDIENLAALVGALGSVNTALKAYNTLKNGGDAAALKGAGGEGARAMYEAAQDELKNAMANFEKKVNSTKFYGGSVSNKVRSSSSKGSSGSSKEKKEKESTKEIIDWIERKNKILREQHDLIEKIANDETVGYNIRIAALNDLIAKDHERMDVARASAERYEKAWNEAITNIKPLDISNIISGNIDLTLYDESVYGEGYIERLKEAMDLYDKMSDKKREADEIEEESTEHLREQVKLQEDLIKAQQELIQGKIDLVDTQLELLEASGGVVNSGLYKQQIALSKELSDAYEDQIANLEEQLGLVDSESAEYYSILASINDCQNEILQCKIQQEEWNEAIKRIPIDRIQKYINLLRNIKTDLQNFLDEQSTLGINPTADQLQELIDLSSEEIDKLMEQQKELSKLLENYQYGSEKFNDVSGEIQDIDNEISSLIQSQREWNIALLQIPLTNLEKVNDNLSQYSNILGETLSEYDDVHSTVLDLLDSELDKINDIIDATNKEYEAKIKPLEDQLELLKETNEEREMQLALEQAEYDLERARNQKTNQVVRNGELVWENDKDAERDAQINYQNTLYDKAVYDLEKQIDLLEKERDALIEGYDLQIERLDSIKNYWEDIIKDIERASNTLNANEVLGSNWKDVVLAGGKGNEQLADYFKGLYEVTYTQKESVDNQIESNERILEMMNEIVDRFNSGVLTYEQALTGIDKLSSSISNGYTALEHLNGMMNLDGISDLSGIASSADSKITESVGLLRDYLGTANTNHEAINKIAGTWDEVKKNIAEQLETLKKLAEELAKQRETVIYFRSDGSGGDDGGGGGSSRGPGSQSGYVAAGPGFSESGMKDAIDRGDSVSFGGSGAGGYSEEEIRDMYDDYVESSGKRHKGAELGAVGKSSDSQKDNLFQQIATKVLKPGERPLVLQDKEWVITPEQRDNILNAIGMNTPSVSNNISQIPYISQNQPSKNIDVNFSGDIVLNDVKDPDGFAKALKVQIVPIMRQEISKIK